MRKLKANLRSFKSNRSSKIVASWILLELNSVNGCYILDEQAIPQEFFNIAFPAKKDLKERKILCPTFR